MGLLERLVAVCHFPTLIVKQLSNCLIVNFLSFAVRVDMGVTVWYDVGTI